MEEVGVRELKAKLSEVLRAVQDGASVRITSRGRPVADLVPPRAPKAEARIAELVAAGTVTPAVKAWPSKPPPAGLPTPGERLPSEVIVAERDSYYES